MPGVGAWDVPPLLDRGAAQVAADDVRRAMWQHAAIDRSAEGLRTCLEELASIESRLPQGATEELNLTQSARLIAEAALLREESRGGHFRSDFPRAKRAWAAAHVVWVGGLPRVERAKGQGPRARGRKGKRP
jgi:L-aspartate oxidase